MLKGLALSLLMDIHAISIYSLNHYKQCCNKYYCTYKSILVHLFLQDKIVENSESKDM